MQISVSGEQRVRVAPERAEVSLRVTQEGADRAQVIAEVTAFANKIGRELDELKAGGVVETFSVQPLQTYAWKPRRGSAERVTATVELQATFTDFEVVGRWTAETGGATGVQLGWVRWTLTDATADRLRDECIAGAVARATQRAEAMARAAGAGAIEISEIADPGLLGAGDSMTTFDAPVMAMMSRSGKAAEPEAVAIVPEEIEIGAQLQLRFVTVR